MVNPLSSLLTQQIQIRQGMLNLTEQINTLTQEINNTPNTAEVTANQIANLQVIHQAFNNISQHAQQIGQIGHVGQDIILGLGDINQKIQSLSLSLQNRVQEQNAALNPFDQTMRAVYAQAQAIMQQGAQQGTNLQTVTNQIESRLKGRVQDLRQHATPEQQGAIDRFLTETEGFHCVHFEKELQKVSESFTADNFENFKNIIRIILPLHKFIDERQFVSQANKERMGQLSNDMFSLLNNFIEMQRAVEEGSDVEESIAERMEHMIQTLNEFVAGTPTEQQQINTNEEDQEFMAAVALSMQQPESTEPVANELAQVDLELLAALAFSTQQPTETVSETASENLENDLEFAAALELSEQQAQTTEAAPENLEDDLEFAAALELSEQQPQTTEAAPENLEDDLEFAAALELSEQQLQAAEAAPQNPEEDDLGLLLALELSRAQV